MFWNSRYDSPSPTANCTGTVPTTNIKVMPKPWMKFQSAFAIAVGSSATSR